MPYILNIIAPLLMGVSIYILFRPDAYISNRFLSFLKIHTETNTISSGRFVRALCNYVPDFLWAYSLTFTTALIFGQSFIERVQAFFVCIVFETAIELLQRFGLISGTFDVWDIAAEAAASLSALALISEYEERTK